MLGGLDNSRKVSLHLVYIWFTLVYIMTTKNIQKMDKTLKKVLNDAYQEWQKVQNPEYSKRYLMEYDKKDNNSNGLTRCICDFLKYKGHHANRINTMGIPRVGKKLINPHTGVVKQSVTFTPTSTQKGTADIKALIKLPNMAYAISVDIEVKFGKDRQSEAQKKYEEQITNAGGVYIIVRDFEDFYNWYQKIILDL